jgi:hypothetical protein
MNEDLGSQEEFDRKTWGALPIIERVMIIYFRSKYAGRSKSSDAWLQEGNVTTSRRKKNAHKNAPFSPYSVQSVKAYIPRSHEYMMQCVELR